MTGSRCPRSCWSPSRRSWPARWRCWRRPRCASRAPARRWPASSIASAVGLALADNQTLAWRAFAVSAGGVAAFLSARRLAEAGHRRALLVAVGAAAVVGAGSVLLESHGLIPTVSMSGAGPGGTEGNRNYMAHVCVAALPLLLVAASRARGRLVSVAALLVVAMALVLSRSRGAWLAGGTALVATVRPSPSDAHRPPAPGHRRAGLRAGRRRRHRPAQPAALGVGRPVPRHAGRDGRAPTGERPRAAHPVSQHARHDRRRAGPRRRSRQLVDGLSGPRQPAAIRPISGTASSRSAACRTATGSG